MFIEASKYKEYAKINPEVTQIESGDRIQAFVKNIQQFGIYCALNLGISGFVKHRRSRKYIIENFKIGDVIDVVVDKISEKSNKIFLKICKYGYHNADRNPFSIANSQILANKTAQMSIKWSQESSDRLMMKYSDSFDTYFDKDFDIDYGQHFQPQSSNYELDDWWMKSDLNEPEEPSISNYNFSQNFVNKSYEDWFASTDMESEINCSIGKFFELN